MTTETLHSVALKAPKFEVWDLTDAKGKPGVLLHFERGGYEFDFMLTLSQAKLIAAGLMREVERASE